MPVIYLDRGRGPGIAPQCWVCERASPVVHAAASRFRLDRRSGELQARAFPASIQAGHGRQEHFRIGMLGSPEYFFRQPHLDDAAAVKDHRFVADVITEREIVGDEEDRQPAQFEVSQFRRGVLRRRTPG